MSDSPKTCFIIGPIGDPDSDAHKRAVSIRAIVKRAVKDLGYVTEHAYEISEPGMIVDQVIKRLVEGRIVIADLTTGNPNVYYEMAIRHSLGKPTINLRDEQETLPFNLGGLRAISININDQYGTEKKIRAAVEEVDKPGYKFTTPFSRALFEKGADDEQKAVATYFDSISNKINLQLLELEKVTRLLEDSMRKPLHGIDEVFIQLDSMLKNAKVGGGLWFVGMTLGLGPPHKYRMSKWPATNRRVQQSEAASADDANPATCNIDELFKLKWKGTEPAPSIDKMINDFHEALGLVVAKAQDPVVVCLTNDKDALEEKFLAKLARRGSYSTLKLEMNKVIVDIMKLHQALAEKVPANKPIKYVDSIPLQILIVERGDALPMSVNKKACVVFHVGTGNIETHVLENGETGFYTEVDSVVEMFETMAESLWEAGTTDPGPLSIPDQQPDSNEQN